MKNGLIRISKYLGFGFLCMMLFGVNGFAYLDPSVVTYLIQAVAGIAIAIVAAVGLYWRRAKKKINDKLGIDENKNKEVESDEIKIDEKK